MLTAKQIASIVAADMAADATGHDLRRRRRFAYQGQIQIRLERNDEPETVSVIDIATHGVRISYSRELQRHATFVARFPRYEGHDLSVLCTVAHCQAHANRLYTIGAEFTCVLTADEKPSSETEDRIREALLESRTHSPASPIA
jgi:hypothetical protein